MIQIRNLTKIFHHKDSDNKVLDRINLTIEQGDICGIIGMSGAGKSTLVRCINYLEKPTEGTVEIDGVDLGSLSERQLREKRRDIGMIFQGFHLLMQKTVRKNIAFGLELIKVKDYLPEGYTREEYEKLGYFIRRKIKRHDIDKTVDELLDIVDLKEKADAYPASLSGGQRQRVAIARALATYPSILLCDEATSALDSMTTDAILDLLQRINRERNITIILITHEMSVVRKICNKVAVIDSSVIVESGPAEQILLNTTSDITRKLIKGGV